MSRVYNVLKLKMQNKLRPDKTSLAPLPPVECTDAVSPNHEMESFEKLVVEGIGKLKAAVTAGEAIAVEQSRQAEQVAGALKAEIAALRTKLIETQDAGNKKEFSYKEMEETLTAKIKDLQTDLARRDDQIKEHKSTIDEAVKQLEAVELANRNMKDEAASHAKRADDLAASSHAKIVTLESKLKETEAIVRQKEWTVNDLEQRLGTKAQDLESTVKEQRELLTRRDTEINDLKSQLTRLTKRISEMSSLFRKAEALTGFEGEDPSTDDDHERIDQLEEKPAAAQSNNATVV